MVHFFFFVQVLRTQKQSKNRSFRLPASLRIMSQSLDPSVLIHSPPQLMLTVLGNAKMYFFRELRKLFDISSWSRYLVLRWGFFFFKWGRKESVKASVAISRRPDEQFIHPHNQWSSLPPLFIPSSFTIPHFTRRGARSPFFFRPWDNGGMVMSAQSSTLSGSVHVSVCGWLTMLGG